ncbi:MAG: tRNA preQ1(34) S-adenosylmethionine ribosyltransferase-isomerase QueA [Lautropia sp.]|nr:tRNA preQ1(34) S-adenosylmethionine ribosyltransferase-isomerase QueA [Lautropia sp.]
MKLSDFDYHLPEELIAQHPPEQRAGGRLLDVSALGAMEAAATQGIAGKAATAVTTDAAIMTGAATATIAGTAAGPQSRNDATAARQPDRLLTDLPSLLEPGSLLVFNDTRVINARLLGRKESGGRVEVMVERLDGEFEVLAMIRASHAPKEGSRLFFGGEHAGGRTGTEIGASQPAHGGGTSGATTPHASNVPGAEHSPETGGASTPAAATVIAARQSGGMMLRLRFDQPAAEVLERWGQLPLPPYIQHNPEADDNERYQTVFAREPGAVAAPTAGLHFDETLLAALRARGIESTTLTLHVGAGTFLPVRTENLAEHRMHTERYHVSEQSAAAIARAKAEGRPVVAIGTTALRALEASGGKAGSGETDLFITPGYEFKVVDRLFTNFHLPKSTLLILVSAFAGREVIRRAYEHAITRRYRFFSYGDAMLLDKAS